MEKETTVNIDEVIQYALGKVYEKLAERSLGAYGLQALVETLKIIKELKSAKDKENKVTFKPAPR